GDVTGLVNSLKVIPRNKSILVVGHSNTVPQIIDGLMEDAQGIVIDDATEFDNLFIVRLNRQNGKKTLVREKYGSPSN
ncbi:MAG: hypothetical protein AAGK97_07200, partial [Bacteroidota bacterium]